MTARVLVSGIDTLELFGRAAVTAEWTDRLAEAKRWADDGAAPVRAPAPRARSDLTVGGRVLELMPLRLRNWPYVLRTPSPPGVAPPIELHANPGARGAFPTLRARLSSAYLWQLGPDAAVEQVRWIWNDVTGSSAVPVQVTRVDLTVDFQGHPFELDDAPRFICRGHTRDPHLRRHGDGCVLDGISFAAGSPLMARLYDKTREIRFHSPDKAWFHDVWHRSPAYDPEEHVWRLEYQIRREVLTDFRRMDRGCAALDTWEDVRQNARRMWSYLTDEWLRFPGQRTKKSRRALDPDVWDVLHREGFASDAWGGDGEDLTRAGRSALLAREDAGLAGRLASRAARHIADHPADAAHGGRDVRGAPYLMPGGCPCGGPTMDEALWSALHGAEESCRDRGTTLEDKARERAARHRTALEELQARLPPRPPEPPPVVPEAPPVAAPVDATPVAPPLPLGWTVH